jgi:hypothetical protein
LLLWRNLKTFRTAKHEATVDSVALALYLVHVLPWAATREALPCASGLRRYWLSSLCRYDAWMTAVSDVRKRQQALTWAEKASDFRFLRPVLEDVLVSEPATRLFAAAASAFPDDREGAGPDARSLASSALDRHVDARQRTLQFMLYGQGFNLSEAVELNRLRRRMERLTDALLALCTPWCEAERFGHDRDFLRRVRSDASGLLPRRRSWVAAGIWQEERPALKRLVEPTFRPDLTLEIVQGAVETFDAAAFDECGSLKVFAASGFSLAEEGKPKPPRRPLPPVREAPNLPSNRIEGSRRIF